MTAQPTSDVNGAPDVIHHPPHYNTHPSGIECVEYAELLPGNLSHVCVYVWRHAHKGNPKVDLEKARWFLHREIGRTLDEARESKIALGLLRDVDPHKRINDRLRHLRRFLEAKEFVATVVFHLFEYQLVEARDLITAELRKLAGSSK